MYSGWLVSHLEPNTTHIYTPEGNAISFSQMSIEHLISISRNPNQNFSVQRSGGYRSNSNVNSNTLAQALHPNQTIQERKLDLERCNRDTVEALQDSLHEAMEEMRRINHTTLSSLYTRGELREILNLTSPDLLIYLIAEGFIDENYYSYMSYFHEGAITKADHQFLLNCQADKDVEPQYIINNPDELCHRLGEVFFEKKQSLNISLFDQLLSQPEKYKSHLNNALKYIQRNFESSEAFLVAYYTSGTETSQLLRSLCRSWKNFGHTVCKSNIAHTHLAQIIAILGDNTALIQQNYSGALTSYLNKNSHLIFNQEICRESYGFLETLGVKINDLEKCSEISEFIDSVIKHSAFSISASNVNLILNHLEVSQDQIDSANYTSIQNCSNDTFREHISNNLTDYIENVFLSLPANSDEDEKQIIALLNRDDIDAELKEGIIDVQVIAYLFETIPKELWIYLLEQEKAVVTWHNLEVYFVSENSNAPLIEFLSKPTAYEALAEQKRGKENRDLVLFVMKNNEITDEAYKKILASENWTIHSLYEGLSEEKWLYLLERDFVKLNANTYATASGHSKLCAELIKNNFKDYSEAKAEYPLENDVIEQLLESHLPDESKFAVCYDIDYSTIEESSNLMALAAECYANKEFDIEDVESTLVELAFSNAPSDSIAIQILCRMIPTWGEEKVMSLLSELGEEYKKIATYGSWVTVLASDDHRQLASLLVEHRYISSAPEKDGAIRFNTKKSAN